MKTKTSIFKRYYLAISAGLLILANVLTFAPQAFALTYLTKPEIILTNMTASGTSALIISFKVSAANTGTGVSITFPAGFTVAASQTYSTSYNSTTCQAITGATAYLPGAPAAAGSGQTITFSGLTAFPGTLTQYCAVLTGTSVTNPGSAQSYSPSITAGTDQAAPVAVSVISTSDQVTVNASVPASFTMSLSGVTDPLNALSSSSITATTGVTVTLSTNGNGWILYGFDSNAGLTSANASHTIASTTPGTITTLTSGSEGYVTGIQSTGNTITAAYDNTSNTSGKGSGLNGTVRSLVTGTGPIASTTATLKEYATISGATAAATDYTDTITLLGAGTF